MMCVTPDAMGAPVAALVRRCGFPARVASLNDGNHFTFERDGATADVMVDADAVVVRALDILAPAPVTVTLPVDGTPRTFAFDRYDAAHADAELAGSADYAFDDRSAYRLDAARELVLSFDPTTKRLARITIGERATLGRMNVLAERIDRRPFMYDAPVLKRSALTGESGTQTTIVRVDVDREGIVRGVVVIVPSADPAYDATLARRLDDDRYQPARLGPQPVAASVFRELHH
jgi:hypothetical protein